MKISLFVHKDFSDAVSYTYFDGTLKNKMLSSPVEELFHQFKDTIDTYNLSIYGDKNLESDSKAYVDL